MPRNIAPLGNVRVARCLDPEIMAVVERADPPPFAETEYDGRLARVRGLLAERGADAILVFRPSSVDYLSGYHSAETAPQPLLVTGDARYLYVLDLEIGRALASSTVEDILYCDYSTMHRALESVTGHVASVLSAGAVVALENSSTGTPPMVTAMLQDAGLSVVDGEALVERCRLVLSEAEIGYVEKAATVTQLGVDAAVAAARDGGTDAQIGAAITYALIAGANSKSAWGPVVATGERGGIAHSTWRNGPLLADVTFIEFAGTHYRYHAPVMRTLGHGELSPKARRLESLAQTALATVLENAAPGVTVSDVAEAAIREIGPLRDDEVFHHMFGYPIGLAHPPHWMDGAPFYISTSNHEPFETGMTFHMPGSMRSFGRRGVGLSQTFTLVEGGTRVLTHGAAEIIPL
ncbi:M24 family metallopeptidase [Pseudonocardia spinosispora]|uniref:M24 family metallopeptidase n=1 Tax=Pseudonocardia spinosispora TaxID=103441 RepID=UPI001FE19443|nr:Xaa-Pro peptidase family protein [Pseudonocardia spinosispora]